MRSQFGGGDGLLLLCVVILVMNQAPGSTAALSDEVPDASAPSMASDARGDRAFDLTLGGYTKIRGAASWPDDDSFYRFMGTDTYYDGSVELRCTTRTFFGKRAAFELDYEAVSLGGDTRRRSRRLGVEPLPELAAFSAFDIPPLNDDRRLFDLAKTLHSTDSSLVYHRLDRLYCTVIPAWGLITVGRQAVTWGNGLIFNPMDLFNPFAPTDIERDYKVGDDMVSTHINLSNQMNLQLLSVVRRDPEHHAVRWDQSSQAAKLHAAASTTEFDLMAAKHYDEYVVGFGSTGYLRDAAWRFDAVWTFLNGKSGLGGFLSLVSNIDYSWVWWDKNFYGLAECYYSGVGEPRGSYGDALTDTDISLRLARGELFALGRWYLASHVTAELHPLFNLSLSLITNLADPSGIVQPRAIWDVAEDVELTFGVNLFWGGDETEYGGFDLPGTDVTYQAPQSAYLWIAFYF